MSAAKHLGMQLMGMGMRSMGRAAAHRPHTTEYSAAPAPRKCTCMEQLRPASVPLPDDVPCILIVALLALLA